MMMDEKKMAESAGYPYPMEVFTAKNTNQTLSVRSSLTQAKTSDAQAPLKIYHESFSLYVFSIVEKDSAIKAVECNMNISELEDIFRRTDYAFQKQMDAEYCPPAVMQPQAAPVPEENKDLPLPYTVTFPDGPYAGKSPADILLDSPNGKQILNDIFRQLKNESDASENKALLLQAITEAARMSKEGSLKPLKKEARMDSPAYTVPIRNGVYTDGKQEYKGCTPAAILSADPKYREALLRQKNWLAGNLAKYPKNQIQIDAIDDAIRLFDKGELITEAGTQASAGNPVAPVGNSQMSVRLYPPTDKLIPKPKIRKEREKDHKCPVHIMEIYWHVGDRSPVEIRITNQYCTVNRTATGMIQPQYNTATDKAIKRMRISEADWMDCIRSIRTDMRNFEMLRAASARADAERVDRQNRKKAEAEKEAAGATAKAG